MDGVTVTVHQRLSLHAKVIAHHLGLLTPCCAYQLISAVFPKEENEVGGFQLTASWAVLGSQLAAHDR